MLDIKILRSYKLQLDNLGYIVDNNQIKDVEFLRSHLRSGKQPQVKQYTNERLYQNNHFLNLYFNNKNFSITNCTYKAILYYLIVESVPKKHYFKCVVKISKLLLKLKMLEVYKISDNEIVIKDNKHNKLFMFKDNKFYRLTNNKLINFILN